MIYLKSRDEIAIMREANRIVVEVMAMIQEKLAPGIATEEMDKIAEEAILNRGGKPAFKGYRGFTKTLCVSINEEVVHGIPGKRRVEEGDIVSIDCGVLKGGFYGDHAWSFGIGKVSLEDKKLLKIGEESLYKGIEKLQLNNRLFDISAAVQSHAEKNGFSVVRDFVGHGIGRQLHEDPQVPNFGEPGTGLRLKPGLVVALEPMINAGSCDVEMLSDGWTVVTLDRKKSVHFEHSVALTDEGPEVLSRI